MEKVNGLMAKLDLLMPFLQALSVTLVFTLKALITHML